MPYASMQDLADKAEWEGGWPSLILEYGLKKEDLPPDSPLGLWEAIHAFTIAYRNFEVTIRMAGLDTDL